MIEAKSGCRAATVGSSLVEYTVVTTVVFRPNTKHVPDVDGHEATWRQAHEHVAHEITKLIERELTKPGALLHCDSAVIVEDMGAQYRELRLHSGTEHCEHTD